MKREFTASVYILADQHVLLIHHKKILKWLPPGGHLEPNETPDRAAIREAYEETGIEVELFDMDDVQIDRENAVSLSRPYLCLLENIPAYQGHPRHQHIDFVYLGRPVGGALVHNSSETNDLRWFHLDQLKDLIPETEIFHETLEVIRSIPKEFSVI